MKKLLTLFLLLSIGTSSVFAQQDVQFTKYMFNNLVFNPAYTGAKEHMALTLLHRTQWLNFPGGPTSNSFTISSPLRNDRLALGASIVTDKIGPTQNTEAYITYAYRIPISGDKYKLSMGLQAGADRYSVDLGEDNITLQTPGDAAFGGIETKILPNFGVGLLFSSERIFASFGVTHLIEHTYKQTDPKKSQIGRQFRHYYVSAGGAIPLNGKNLVFRPSVMVKNVGWDSKFRKDPKLQTISAPTSIDLDLSLFFFETFWVGSAYRTSWEAFNKTSSDDSFDVWASYYFKNGLRIGGAYDFTVSELGSAGAGPSFEVMLGYEFDYKNDKIVTPRYF